MKSLLKTFIKRSVSKTDILVDEIRELRWYFSVYQWEIFAMIFVIIIEVPRITWILFLTLLTLISPLSLDYCVVCNTRRLFFYDFKQKKYRCGKRHPNWKIEHCLRDRSKYI